MAKRPTSVDEACAAIGRGLKAHRLAQDVTQSELARRADVSSATLKRIEASGAGSLHDVMQVAWSLGLQVPFAEMVPEPEPHSIEDVLKENRRHVRRRASARRHVTATAG